MASLVGAVIVAYHPNKTHFKKALESTSAEVDYVVVVNNGSKGLIFECLNTHKPQIEFINNNNNLGVAEALNIGINCLRNKGCSYFLLLDQDSIIPNRMVAKLIAGMTELSHRYPVAAIGPSYFNTQLKIKAPFIRFNKLNIMKVWPKESDVYVETDFLITSGTLLTLEAINNIGLMDDRLFIDYVDTEWCLRAISKGYKIYGLNNVEMEHALGDDPVIFFNKKMPMHSPLRHYYISRNALHLATRKYIPFNRRVIILMSMLKTFIFYSLIPSNRLLHFKMMCKGIYDAVLSNYGRYDKLTK